MQFEEFKGCMVWWSKREENDQAWKVSAKELLESNCDLDRKNPRGKVDIEHLPPDQLAEDILNKELRIAELMREIFDYNRADGITAGQYDFFGTAIHEITEVMGRVLGVGQQLINNTNTYYPLDLFHYVNVPPEAYQATAGEAFPEAQTAQQAILASGTLVSDELGIPAGSIGVAAVVGPVVTAPEWHVHDFSRGGYFSFDGGTTELADFNPLSSGDAGDWAPSAGNDSFLNVSYPGVINNVTAVDLSVMDILGYDRAPIRHLPVDEIAKVVQGDYFAITRTTLPLDQAITEANLIDAGAHTEAQYINDLLAQAADKTIPAVAVEASMYGAVPTSDEIKCWRRNSSRDRCRMILLLAWTR